jgi:hypothetical protein
MAARPDVQHKAQMGLKYIDSISIWVPDDTDGSQGDPVIYVHIFPYNGS